MGELRPAGGQRNGVRWLAAKGMAGSGAGRWFLQDWPILASFATILSHAVFFPNLPSTPRVSFSPPLPRCFSDQVLTHPVVHLVWCPPTSSSCCLPPAFAAAPATVACAPLSSLRSYPAPSPPPSSLATRQRRLLSPSPSTHLPALLLRV